jgi:methyl-accepting chemotaxis protein
MSEHNGTALGRRLRLLPSQLRWRLALASAPVAMVSLVLLSMASYRAASETLRQQVLQQLSALQVNTARQVEHYFGGLQANVESLARDPSTVRAMMQLASATAELDGDPLTEPARMRSQMESLKRSLEDYYQKELRDKSVNLRTLLLPQRSAVWLQAAYIGRSADSPANTGPPDPNDATHYARAHALWDPFFRRTLDRFGLEDVFLVDPASGRVVYSVGKQPDFQTSLLDGPYAATSAGVVFRGVQRAGSNGGYRIVDFAAYPPAHGMPTAFAGMPIVDDGRMVGALVVQLSSTSLTRLVSADRQWSRLGLGETGELYLFGRGDDDLLMRTDSRFGRSGEDTTTILRQRIESPAAFATTEMDEYEGEYVSYRGVPVLGSAARLAHLNGLNWTVIAESSTAEALRPLARLRTRITWLTALLLLGTILCILGVSVVLTMPARALMAETAASKIRAHEHYRRLETSLRQVATAAAAASNGDLSQRLAVDDDLLGDLPHTLNRMWQNFGALVSHVHNLCTAATEPAAQIQSAVRHLSENAVQHTTDLAGSTALLRDTRLRLDALATEAAAARRTEPSVDAQVCACAESVRHAVAGMEELQKHTQALTLKMKRLGERSMEISTVTAALQAVTAQANMLALNATIEASRAGEHGLGFKTVANDIRKLGARTEAAAKDIIDLVTTLHGEAADAVDGIDRHAEEIDRHTALMTDASQTLGRCRNALAPTEHSSATATALGEQAAVLGKLGDAMLRLAEFVRRTHVLSEQAVHTSATLLGLLSELKTRSEAVRLRAGNEPSTVSSRGDMIELTPRDAVGNGRRAGA